jgi:mono/diheme cytochrome c family protein
MISRSVLAIGSVTLIVSAVLRAQEPSAPQPAAPRTVWSGLYSSAQAARGQVAYDRACAECHMTDLSGHEYAGALAGFGFLLKWQDASLAELFGRVRSMPIGRIGTVALQEHLDILAYMLQKNGYPEGAGELTLAVAAQRWPRILIERRR